MAKPLELEGAVEILEQPDAQQSRREVEKLEDQVRSLRHEVDDLHRQRDRLFRSIENLRTILGPVYRGLRVIFGEIELAVGEEPTLGGSANGAPSPSTGDPRWQNFKTSFPGVGAEIIDALLIHGEMKMTNLSKLLKRHYNTVQFHAAKLKGAGAITSAGGLLSLKR